MKHPTIALIRPWTLLPLAAALALSLSACGGGGGGSVGSLTGTPTAGKATLSGTAIDAPIAGASITITAGAPLNDTGATTAGTITADGNGQFTITVALPAGNVPIFANAVDPANPGVILTSYLGSSSALIAAGTLTTSNLPDLDISPVSTAALAVYAQTNGGSYAGLTPTTYASTLQTYRSDILAIAAAIKAVGDNLCTPSPVPTSTTNLAAEIAAGSNLTSGNSSTYSTTLTTAATTLGGNCPTVLASLPQEMAADPDFAPELDLGDVIDAGVQSVTPGTYQLQGVIAETGMTNASGPSTSPNPASVFTDNAITVDSSGNVTSADGNVTGTLVGNLINLSVTDTSTNGTQSYNLRGKIGSIPTALVNGGPSYSIQSGGRNTSNQTLTNFEAVLVPAGAAPVWNGIAAPAKPQMDGVFCSAGAFPVRLDAFGAVIGGGSVGECITPTATGWNMMPAGPGASFNFDDVKPNLNPPSLSNLLDPTAPAVWTEVSTPASPFILTDSNVSFSRNGVTTPGTTYYVMGTQAVVFASANRNNLLSLHDTPLTRLSEMATNDGGDSSSQQQQDH
ncbi:hypothetical protein [Thiomonas sp. FB-Cd]|uniref:hypothetical protein n=1 Tax=Thiomonas sp. FB-Cd TaxID=1158292 RepID=UPI00068A94C6|nr:hypothetical protein [Thiomonas sp. FB-Cd]